MKQIKGDDVGGVEHFMRTSARPQPWHDQRNVLNAQPIDPPQSIDFTDLHLLGWKPSKRKHRSLWDWFWVN